MREAWEPTTLGDIVKINPRPTRKRTDDQPFKYVDISSVRYGSQLTAETLETHTNATAPSRAKREILAGDVVVSTVRPNLRGVARVPNSLNGEIASTGFAVLRAIPERCTDGFLWALVSGEAFSNALSQVATGSNYPAVSSTDIANQQVALPPLLEQKRIADLMDSVDAAISAAQDEVDAAVKLRQRMLWNALAAPGRGWEQMKFGDVAETLLGKSLSRGEGQTDGGTPYLRYANVGWGTLDTSALNRMTFSEEEARKYSLRVGDLLVAEARHVGKCVVVNEPLDGICYQNSLHRVRANETRTSNHFLALTLEHLVNDGTVARFTTAQTIPHLSQSKLRALPINLPPFDEQRTIVETMSSLHAATSTGRAALDCLHDLRASMLSALLSGEHEIPETYDQFVDLSEVVQAG